MKCSLCELEIIHYSKNLNQLVIDTAHVYEICQTCINKFMKWQRKNRTSLFPTIALKKSLKMKNEK